jgi:transposase-like protein
VHHTTWILSVVANTGQRAQRRAAVAELLADGHSVRAIARQLGVDHATILRDRRALNAARQPGPGSPVPNHAGSGNTRSMTHGATHEPRLGPRREHHARDLRRRYPALDELRLTILADRMARLDVASRWLDERGVVRDARGNVFPVVNAVEEWGRRVENVVSRLEAEAQPGRGFTVADAMSEADCERRARMFDELGLGDGGG